MRPQVSGFIVKLCVDEGATVKKGQALFQIDPTPVSYTHLDVYKRQLLSKEEKLKLFV